MCVEDAIDPGAAIPAIARFHLAPGLRLQPETPGGLAWRVLEGSSVVAGAYIEAGEASVEDWLHAQRFGLLVPAQTLAVRLDAARCIVRWRW